MIAVRNLSAHYGAFRIRSVSFEVRRGEVLVLLGPSGAGKTLLLESILGLSSPDAGEVLIDGVEVTRLPPERRGVAYIPQDLGLFPHLSVRDNILFGRRMRKTLRGAEQELTELAQRLRIEHLLGRRSIRGLSGGERQRVALARALIVHPRVLFLDESFSALDAHIRQELLGHFRELQRQLRQTAIYVTHNQDEVFAIADRVAILMEGVLCQLGSPEAVFTSPVSTRVARFLLLPNLLDAHLELDGDGTAVARVGELALKLPVPAGAPPAGAIAFAPEDATVAPAGRREGANWFSGEVVEVRRVHHRTYAHIRVPHARGATVQVALPSARLAHRVAHIEAGRTVAIHVPPEAITWVPHEPSLS